MLYGKINKTTQKKNTIRIIIIMPSKLPKLQNCCTLLNFDTPACVKMAVFCSPLYLILKLNRNQRQSTTCMVDKR